MMNWTCGCGKKANDQHDTKDWKFLDDWEPPEWLPFDPFVESVSHDAYCPECYELWKDRPEEAVLRGENSKNDGPFVSVTIKR